MSEQRSLDIRPVKALAGSMLVVTMFDEPPADSQWRIWIGEKVAEDLFVRDAQTILCRVPEDTPGVKSVVLSTPAGEWARAEAALEHLGPSTTSARPPATVVRLPASVSRVPEKRHEEGPPPITDLHPASNWWMVHQQLDHAANALADAVSPLRQLWSRTVPHAFSLSQPIIGDQHVLVGILGDSDVDFVALDPNTGAIRWQRRNPGWEVWGHPVAVSGRVYFIERERNNTSRIVCLAISDGAELWTDMLPPGAAPGGDKQSAGLAAAYRQVYCFLKSGRLRAYRADTGALNWEAAADPVSGPTRVSSPALGFGNVYVGTDKGLRAFKADVGTPIWIAGAANGSASPVVVSDVGVGNPAVVVIGCVDRMLRAYHAWGGTQVWQFASDSIIDGWAPAVSGRKLYLWQSGFRKIVELDVVSGLMTAASVDLGARIVAPPTATRGYLLVVLRTSSGVGRIVSLRLPGLTIAHHHPIPEPLPGDETRIAVEGSHAYLAATRNDVAVPWTDTIHAFRRRSIFEGLRTFGHS